MTRWHGMLILFLSALGLGAAGPSRAEVISLTVGINSECPYGIQA